MKKCMAFITVIFIVPIMILIGTMFHTDVPIDLYGIVSENPKPIFTSEGVFDGSYQEGFNNWYKDSHPLRALFVKMHNQIMYGMNSCLFSGDIVVGKEGWLYSKEYISACFEEISDDTRKIYDDYVKKVKLLQDNLEASGKKFVYIISPNKVDMYPEFLPYRFQMILKNKDQIRNNYDYLLQRLKAENINCIDAKTILFDEAGDIPFFTGTGIHWNYYAAAVCAKEVVKQMDECKDIYVEVLKNDSPFGAEQDIYALTNIFRGTVDKEYYGGILACNGFTDRTSKKVLEMGTSFSVELADIFCADGSFMWDEMIRYQYFVNKTRYKSGMRTGDVIHKEELNNEIISADIILMENNASYIPESHFEFVEEALKLSVEELGSAQRRK